MDSFGWGMLAGIYLVHAISSYERAYKDWRTEKNGTIGGAMICGVTIGALWPFFLLVALFVPSSRINKR